VELRREQGKAEPEAARREQVRRRHQQGRQQWQGCLFASLSLSSLFRWRLARIKRGVVVGPAEMGLPGLRFKVGERRQRTYGL
jgi:hypothetical protein